MFNLAAVISGFLLLATLVNAQEADISTPPSNTTACNIKRGNISGICKPISDCPAGIGLLRAGVSPEICESEDPGTICCPTEKRISIKKCEEFNSILTQSVKAKHPLVYDGRVVKNNDGNLSALNKTIICESFVIGFISGGRKAKEREYPFQAALGYGDDNDKVKAKPDWRCGGTLIDDQFILTAGHCIITAYGPPKVALLGDRKLSYRKDSTRLIANISEIFLHPKYKPPLQYYDIALVKLEAPVNKSRGILPACLPNPKDRLDRAMGVEATGWGQTGAMEGQSDLLLSTTISKFNSKECSKYFETSSSSRKRLPQGILPSQFCAGDKHGSKDTCKGDSGGPVTVTKASQPSCVHYVVGITSFGSNMCGFQLPGVYTNVLSFLDWIEDIVWEEDQDAMEMKNKSKLHSDIKTPSNTGTDQLVLNPLVGSSTTTHQRESTLPSTITTMKHQQPIHTTDTTTIKPIPTSKPSHNTFSFPFSFNISGTISNIMHKISFGK